MPTNLTPEQEAKLKEKCRCNGHREYKFADDCWLCRNRFNLGLEIYALGRQDENKRCVSLLSECLHSHQIWAIAADQLRQRGSDEG